MHYEIEQAGAGEERRPDVGTHAEPERWHVVRVFNADAVPMPLLRHARAGAGLHPSRPRTAPDRGGERRG